VNVLVVASEPIGPEQLREALGSALKPQGTHVMVVTPALHEGPLKFWLSDADEAIAHAVCVQRETLKRLDAAGVPASADTGEGDPLEAITDALQTFRADRIVIFTHPEGEQRYREGLDPTEVEQRFGLPVDAATV
jgi:hypothetical protein